MSDDALAGLFQVPNKFGYLSDDAFASLNRNIKGVPEDVFAYVKSSQLN